MNDYRVYCISILKRTKTMKKFYNHLWTNYKSREEQYCKTCDVMMNSNNLKGNCFSKHVKQLAKNELSKEGKAHFSHDRGMYYSSLDMSLKMEEITKRNSNE